MTMKPVTMVLGVVAVIVVGIAAYQYSVGGLSIGGPGEPRIVAANELPGIVLTADDAPDGMTFDGTYRGLDTLTRLPASLDDTTDDRFLEQPGFVAGMYTEFSHERAGLLSWAALFATVEDAELALSVYETEAQSAAGYGMTTRVEAELGDEGAYFGDGIDPEFNAQIYLWRAGNLLLATASYGEFDSGELGQIAQEMDDRAR